MGDSGTTTNVGCGQVSTSRRVIAQAAAIGIACACAVATFFWLQQRANPAPSQVQDAAFDALDDLVRLDATWTADVLKSAVELHRDYDPITAPVIAWPPFEQRMRSALAAALPAADAERWSARLSKSFADKAAAVNAFKMHNAVLRNSLRYLPSAQADIFALASTDAHRVEQDVRRREANQARAASAMRILSTASTADSSSRSSATRALADDLRDANATAKRLSSSLSLSAANAATATLVGETLRFNVATDNASAELLREHNQEFKRVVQAYPEAIRDQSANLARHIDIVLRERGEVSRLLAAITTTALPNDVATAKEAVLAHTAATASSHHAYGKAFAVYTALLLACVLLGAVLLVRRWLVMERDRADLQGQVDKLMLGVVQADRYATLGQMSEHIAHEVNTPLSVVASAFQNTQRFLEQCAATLKAAHPEEYDLMRRCLHDGYWGSEQIKGVVGNLLGFVRGNTSTKQPAHVAELVKTSLMIARAPLLGRGAQVETHLATTPPIACNAAGIRQVLVNLFRNAAEAMPSGGTLVIESRHVGDKVQIIVRDNGPGMAPEVLANLFKPHFTTKARGVGVGLALSKSIIDQHEGSITVRSAPGRGSEFTLLLPVARLNPDDMPAEQADAVGADASGPRTGFAIA